MKNIIIGLSKYKKNKNKNKKIIKKNKILV